MDHDTIGLALGLIAGTLNVAAYLAYNRRLSDESSRPNPVAWGIWTVIDGLNLLTYVWICRDWPKAVMPAVTALACAATFLRVMFSGRLARPDRGDTAALAGAITAVLVWHTYRSAALANLLLQGARILAFVPVVRTLCRDPAAERPLPWFCWSAAAAVLFAAVCLRWRGQPAELAYPAVGFAMNAAVAALSLRRPRRTPA